MGEVSERSLASEKVPILELLLSQSQQNETEKFQKVVTQRVRCELVETTDP